MNRPRPSRVACVLLLLFAPLVAPAAWAVEPSPPGETLPTRPDATEEALKQMLGFRIPEGLKVDLFAAEPKLGNPVAFTLDEKGRVFVAESYRFARGTEENRKRGFFLEDDLQIETLDERLKMYQKWEKEFPGGMAWFSKYTDQIRLVEDVDRDGRADSSKVFATGFNAPLDGLAAGILVRNGDVYFTCIPDLWRLRDTNGDGVADERTSLVHGFGINCAYLGHDLHGVVFGPDGKLYFSIGDRGYDVSTPDGKRHHQPRTGAVFRCQPDGSEFEVIATGLRNPQELVFDKYGQLWADDNNCDKGDHARLEFIVDGADCGWNMSHQTMPEPYLVGPWHAEKMWHVPNPTAPPEQPAYVWPCVGKLGAGPSGFAYDPGVGLPAKYRGYFFMGNYTGNGGVEAFTVKPFGAGYEIVDYHDFLKPMHITDCEFGWDGKFYVSDYGPIDWNNGGGRGRVFTVADPSYVGSEAAKKNEKLVADGIDKLPFETLVSLLSHDDQRIRQMAQFALVAHGGEAREAFNNLLTNVGLDPVVRLHAIWGLGQLGAKDPGALALLVPHLNDRNAHVRIAAVKTLGDRKHAPALAGLVERLKDDDLHVRLHAAIALGELGDKTAFAPLVEMIRANTNDDPWLRHAGVMGLLGVNDVDAVLALAGDASPVVRISSLLVLRRLADPRVAKFLDDADPRIVTEAARAIQNVPIPAATPALAKLAAKYSVATSVIPDALARRVLYANFRLGTLENAKAVAALASSAALSPAVRAEAIAELADWTQPGPRDRVNGAWRPLEPRDPAIAREAVSEAVPAMLSAAPADLQGKIVELIAKVGAPADDATFLAWVKDEKRPDSARVAALRLLAKRLKSDPNREKLTDADPRVAALSAAIASNSPHLRAAANDETAELLPADTLPQLKALLADGQATRVERQSALATLARLGQPAADAILAEQVAALVDGRAPEDVRLDIYEAAAGRNTPALLEVLKRFDASASGAGLKPAETLALVGGDAEKGRALFVGHLSAQCLRCHKVGDSGGDAGPNLSDVGKRLSREELRQSLLDPSAKMAKGFESVALTLVDGRVLAGVIKDETPTKITLTTPDGKIHAIDPQDVEDRSKAASLMPAMGQYLTPRQIRDLIEYLAQQGRP